MNLRTLVILLSTLAIIAPAQGEEADATLATYGNLPPVTRHDLEAAIRLVPPQLRDDLRHDPKRALQTIENVMVYRALADEARQLGLDKQPEVQAEVLQAIEKVLGNRRLDTLEQTVTFPDFTASAKEQYVLNQARYRQPEAVHAAHILVAAKGRSDAEAKQRIDEIRAKAASGADFETLAKEYTDDRGTRLRGGDLGFFTKGKMVKAFEEAAFAMSKPGEISPVIQTEFGYHILKLIERREASEKPFEAVKEEIVQTLKARLINDERARHLSKIRNDPNIKMNKDAIDQLVAQPAGASPRAPTKP
jgi:peptidyl-prolyl cis-trans isomerase C